MRLDLNLPVVAVTLFAAALLQDQIPPTALLPAKAGFLTAVALYQMLTKPVPVALTALFWAGGLTDLLGGLPVLCTSGFLLVAYGVVRLLQRVFLEANVLHGMLLMAGVSLAQAVWTMAWVAAARPVLVSTEQVLTAIGYRVLAGLLAGGVGFAIGGLVDRVSGNIRPVKEANGISWAKTDR